jgi:hypothetical protein
MSFPKSSIGGPAPIFWPNFLEKILKIKIVLLASPRRGCYATQEQDEVVASSGEHGVDAIAIAASRVGS